MAVENAPVMDYRFASGRLTLSGHLAVPTTGIAGAPGLVLLHGFPTRGRESEQSGKSFPELAERVASELGWVVLTINFRGCGAAEGDFSLVGWLDDVHAAVGHLSSLGVSGVWLAGFGTGGSLAVCEGARNRKVRGVAALATPGDFEDWSRQPRQLLLLRLLLRWLLLLRLQLLLLAVTANCCYLLLPLLQLQLPMDLLLLLDLQLKQLLLMQSETLSLLLV
jgi:pimeloyl-ACP methyl ester carboxylesterase